MTNRGNEPDEAELKLLYLQRLELATRSDVERDDDPFAEIEARGRQQTSLVELMNFCLARLFQVFTLLLGSDAVVREKPTEDE